MRLANISTQFVGVKPADNLVGASPFPLNVRVNFNCVRKDVKVLSHILD